ncbi:MAG: helicase domain protein [Elusimicrobia bacterium]|nr:MAG: helicase domain protein [Elusimicrobiota bacterium]KAF0158016.1 MAG: helicase domain protein [Elusimicrobiota bacterium]
MSHQFITNQERLLSDVINNILPSAARLYFLVGYFYFSGFKEIYKNLDGRHVRILVGLDAEKDIINAVRECETLTGRNISRGRIRDNHNKWFVKLYNETDFFDSGESQEAFRTFLEKIKTGSLEIRKTLEPNHAKLYIFENKPEFSQKGDFPGTVITGSSNLSRAGLRDRHEINVVFRDEHFKEAKELFEALWKTAVTIADKNNFEFFRKEVIEKIWFGKLPTPYLMYIRVLDEYFSIKARGEIELPADITRNKFLNLKYQTDAVKQGLEIIKKHNGVIIADVVGLGKSIIASAITYNLKTKAIVIAPPHLCDQWDSDYRYMFNLNARVYSSGSIEKALEEDDGGEKVIIVDEAHKYRNENTDDYANLHKLCQGKKVILLTATPFNNRPQDIFAMIRLFQIPARSTIRTVDNLSCRFQELIREYKKIEKAQKEKSKTALEIKAEVNAVARKIRDILSPIVIRRSRIDLQEIEEYKTDLALQKISFPEVKPPELATYNLGSLSALYRRTLEEISPDSGKGGFQGVRYNPAHYLKKEHKLEYAEEFTGLKGAEAIGLLEQGQANLAIFMRRLLVRRFESSIHSFRRSLGFIIHSSEKVKEYYDKLGKVPVYKKGDLPAVETLIDSTGDELENIDELLAGHLERGLHFIEKEKLEDKFIKELEKDIKLLKDVRKDWSAVKNDPKVDDFKAILKTRLKENSRRKIIVFTEFADTAAYLGEAVKGDFRVFKYSSSDAGKENKKTIRKNFDAGYPAEKQMDDFDILIATDAMSEGINLHRAGIVFNYDIPYNPTRVIQRVGRINRVNKKVFDKLYIYNYFPTATGEDETRTKEISTLKIAMIHALMGEDTRYLTRDEDLKSFYKEQYDKFIKDDERSWDVDYRNLLASLRSGRPELITQAENIPPRTKIRRTVSKGNACASAVTRASGHQTARTGVLVFAQKGGEFTFSFGPSAQEAGPMSPEEALKLFEAEAEEKPQPLSKAFEPIYKNIKKNLFAGKSQVPFDKGKRDATDKLRALKESLPVHRDYLEDLLTVIEKLDSLPAHYLKFIRAISEKKLDADVAELLRQVPHKYLAGLLNQANSVDEGEELLILAEEF